MATHLPQQRRWFTSRRLGGSLLLAAIALLGCGQSDSPSNDTGESAGAVASPPASDSSADEPSTPIPSAEPTPLPIPVQYVPAGSPGSADAYNELLRELERDIPAELRDQVPWPDIRNPNPIVAQIEIFDLWIWMEAHHPDPNLVEIMSAPGSPSREEVVAVFGRINASGQLKSRLGAQYEAYDHQVITFESSGLPLWLARDVPEDAVVVYYSDRSGPATVTDRETGEIVGQDPAVPERAWLSIMVPTDVGWQLWRDQLIEPTDSELRTPEIPPPGDSTDRPKPEV